MESQDWSWFHAQLQAIIEPVLARHGFHLLDAWVNEPDYDDEEYDMGGAGRVYANQTDKRIGIDVMFEPDFLNPARLEIFWLRGGFSRNSLTRLLPPGPLAVNVPLDGWQCLNANEVEQQLKRISDWMEKHMSEYL